jgi:uncharacterized membrane protein
MGTTAPQPQSGGTTSGGLTPNVAGGLAYFWFMAIVWLVLEPYNKDKFIRFHSFQALGLAVAWIALYIVLAFIPIIGWILLIPVNLAMFVLWIICVIKAFQNDKFKVPVIGNFAEEQAAK